MTTVKQPVGNIRPAAGLCTQAALMVNGPNYCQTALMLEPVQKFGLKSPVCCTADDHLQDFESEVTARVTGRCIASVKQ